LIDRGTDPYDPQALYNTSLWDDDTLGWWRDGVCRTFWSCGILRIISRR
jgi:hypothetical protein